MKKKKPDAPKGSETKREKLLEEKKKFPLVKVVVILLVTAIPLAWFMFRDSPEAGSGSVPGSKVTEKVSYRNQTIGMTPVDTAATGDYIEIPVEIVKEKKLVSFEYKKAGKQVPLMAYITPSGKLVTAVSMCEPCRSTKFHIEGEQMVCNACGTRWTLEGLRGVSGGCLEYPPDVVSHTIEGGKVRIKETIILDWKPRA
ncbi:MAG: hypothetical protein A2X96_05570 [Syntrophobacterales bacterium GWC2_56_13]|nr:MAG: hypothetical protein A2X96_05570 [Syntrophobacterales bacterium GWC2_56_13]OHE21153.1 MAG: hypothetical protein A2X95_02590 [Syntrophobacterales bacterium GWF2_56_9]